MGELVGGKCELEKEIDEVDRGSWGGWGGWELSEVLGNGMVDGLERSGWRIGVRLFETFV